MMPQIAFMVVKSENERRERENNPNGLEAELRDMQLEAAAQDCQPAPSGNVFSRLFGVRPIAVRQITSDECA